MTVGEWEFIEVRRDEIKDPPNKDFDMIFYDCTHVVTGIKIPRSFMAYKPIDNPKFESFLKTIADEMSKFDSVRLRLQQ